MEVPSDLWRSLGRPDNQQRHRAYRRNREHSTTPYRRESSPLREVHFAQAQQCSQDQLRQEPQERRAQDQLRHPDRQEPSSEDLQR